MPVPIRHALVPILIVGAITGAYALRHSSTAQPVAASTAMPNLNLKLIEANAPEEKPLPVENPPETNPSKPAEGRATINEMLAQIIATAIDNGSLNPATFTAQQLAQLPQWLKDKIAAEASRRLAEAGKHSADDETEQPEPPQKFPCPEPGHLPAEWNDVYNKAFLRQQGCQL